MKHLTEKVSYVRGLMEGLKLDTQSDMGKVLSQIVDLLGEMADEVEDLQLVQEEMGDYVESIDESLSEIEDAMDLTDDEDFDDEDFEDEDFDDEDEEECTGDCEACEGCTGADEDENVFVECMCPSCQSTFYVLESELGDNVFHICPRCGEKIHVEPDYDEEIPVAELAQPENPEE